MCYRLECIKECDKFKRQTCQHRLNRKQLRHKLNIGRYTCMDCGRKMVRARYRGIETMVCTKCNHILQQVQRVYVRGA